MSIDGFVYNGFAIEVVLAIGVFILFFVHHSNVITVILQILIIKKGIFEELL